MTDATDTRHPDIEIYLSRFAAQTLEAWLAQTFDRVIAAGRQGNQLRYTLEAGNHRVPLLVIEKAAGKYTSLWFDSAHTPWARDLDCAREAAATFNCEVRCIASGWQEGDDPDEWWSVASDATASKISWQDN